MNKKISMGICLSLVIIAITATFAITMVFSKQIYNGIISNISQRSKTFEGTEEINKIIFNNYYGDLSEYNNNLNAALADGYVKCLNDSNSCYMTSSEYNEYIYRIENGITGAGIETLFDYSTGNFTITYVYEGSPAEKAGLASGDVITAVGNVTVTRNNYQELQKQFIGTKLQTAKIEYIRNEETKTAEPMLGFSIPSVTHREYGELGYIRISKFYKNTADELDSVLDYFKQIGMESVIIDLRNTSDGTVKYAADALDTIVPGSMGCIAVTKDNKGGTKTLSPQSSSHNFKFCVLINGNTSGPAELFACDLRDMKQASLIGTKTAGLGTMQDIFNLDDGGALKLTVALVIPRDNENLVYDGVGVSPSIEVVLEGEDENIALLAEAEDNQLQTAMNLMIQ